MTCGCLAGLAGAWPDKLSHIVGSPVGYIQVLRDGVCTLCLICMHQVCEASVAPDALRKLTCFSPIDSASSTGYRMSSSHRHLVQRFGSLGEQKYTHLCSVLQCRLSPYPWVLHVCVIEGAAERVLFLMYIVGNASVSPACDP